MGQRLTLNQFTRVIAQLEPKTEAAAVRGFRRAGAYLVRTVVVEIGQATPRAAVDTGELRNSVDITLVDGGCVVAVDSPHASVIEYGRRPGARMPPVQAIMDWMRRKGLKGKRGAFAAEFKAAKKRVLAQATAIVGRSAARASQKQDRAGHEDAALRGMAFAMARGIGKHGIAPRHYFRKAFDRATPVMVRMVNLEMARAGWKVKPGAIKALEQALGIAGRQAR